MKTLMEMEFWASQLAFVVVALGFFFALTVIALTAITQGQWKVVVVAIKSIGDAMKSLIRRG